MDSDATYLTNLCQNQKQPCNCKNANLIKTRIQRKNGNHAPISGNQKRKNRLLIIILIFKNALYLLPVRYKVSASNIIIIYLRKTVGTP